MITTIQQGYQYRFWHWGGDTWGGQGSDGGDRRVIRDKIWRCLKQARNVNKKGCKWLFCPLFTQKFAKYVLLEFWALEILDPAGGSLASPTSILALLASLLL